MFAGGSFWDQAIKTAVAHSPVYAVLLCAMVLAVVRSRRHPKASMLLTAGVVVVLIDYALTLTGCYDVVAVALVGAPRVGASGDAVAMIGNLMSSTVAALGFALLAAAVFVERVRPYADVPPEMRRDG